MGVTEVPAPWAVDWNPPPNSTLRPPPCTHQAGGLKARGGCVDPPHPGDGLVVVDEPLSMDLHVW